MQIAKRRTYPLFSLTLALASLAACSGATPTAPRLLINTPLFAKPAPTTYLVTLSNPGASSWQSGCNSPVAPSSWVTTMSAGKLTSIVTNHDFGYFVGTGLTHQRTYPSPTLVSFDAGCHGYTTSKNGGLFIQLTSTTITFNWYFDYYIGNVREHFRVHSATLPLAGWNGTSVSGHVSGPFTFGYHNDDGRQPLDTDFAVVPLSFDVSVVKQ